jgi:NDP-mannose synthase
MRAVILAGGQGTRLRPYTTIFPKPLMPIGEMPILEIVLRQLEARGFHRITLAVSYLAELIETFFGDGGRLGIRLDYSREGKPLSTAGPLALVPGLDETFLVMNGDILTTLDYAAMAAHHRASGAAATIGLHRRSVRIDYGVVETDPAGRLRGYIEKPTMHYAVSMGIYILEPRALAHIRPDEALGMPDLMLRLKQAGEIVGTFEQPCRWLDIGRTDDYGEALETFEAHRAEFLPATATGGGTAPAR